MSTRISPVPGAPAIFDSTALVITTVLTLAFVVLAYYQVPWVLIPLGLFVLFVAPGYAVDALLFGQRAVPSLAANIALVVGFSVLFNVVLGTVILLFAITPLAPLVGLGAAAMCTAATIVQVDRDRAAGAGHRTRRLRSFFELPGFTSPQRVAAYALFVGILFTFAAIGYLSTVQPGKAPDLSLGVVGPDGTTSTLPTSGTVNSTLTVLLDVQNNATTQSLLLSVNSSLVGTNETNWTSIPWAMPLQLAPQVTSSELITLTSGEAESVDVSFQFSTGGDYAVSFSLTPPQSHVAVRTSGIAVQIT